MINLALYERPVKGTTFLANIRQHAPNWRRTIKAVGGYGVGSFTAQGLTRDQMQEWFDRYLGCRIVETTFGIVSWEGYIHEMRLIIEGVEYARTLDEEWWHNKVRALYSSGAIRASAPTGLNLVSNPGFETAGAGGADVFGSWTEHAGDGSIVDELVNVQSGSHAVKLVTGASADTYVAIAISVTPGVTYTVTIPARGDGTYAGRYGILDAISGLWIKGIGSTGVTAAAYSNVNTSFVAPTGCTSVSLYLYCPSTGLDTFFDDISVTAPSWTENADASDEYGEMQYIVSMGGVSAAGAAAMKDRHLKEFAWPRSRMVGAVQLGPAIGASEDDSLTIDCVGFWQTLNWRYREGLLAAANASAHVSTLVGLSEFVTTGRVETNTLSVSLTVLSAARLGDLLRDIIKQGDASGNVWQGGVFANRQFVYEQAPTTVSHYLRNGVLYDLAGAPVVPSLLLPGILVQNAAVPLGYTPAGTASAWDNPQIAYAEEVEFSRPDRYSIRWYGQEESVELIQAKLGRGTDL